ncbi:DExH-box ATP-dependent RNA helicase DExH3 isoform X4 [Amborella trichopoda]|uniref:DExH-box ATP-dependent RNA helicase DExH3 isoform X4 n=1 Tax=Amborella trichopoda TaxID=13333 RepID=UPI0005D3B8D8|nr:DExH-box ATP-dependent RNA helicase DExH3 isoform X4 [Amborella trichopoda]|eukprot:XP_011623212.1 DExH-box ATP-dependent RNA helicase DExH3 isoform X4 [Amborella trichopoda]
MPYLSLFRGYSRSFALLIMSLSPNLPRNLRQTCRAVCPSMAEYSSGIQNARRLQSVCTAPFINRGVTTMAPVFAGVSTRLPESEWREDQRPGFNSKDFGPFSQPSMQYGRCAYDDYSDDESDREMEPNKGTSTLDNLDEWKWKLTKLIRNKEEEEVVSRDKKDRRDYEQLSALATRMGLYCRQYEKVVVVSKLPLPNYRSDLDAKRPQREVLIPVGLQRRVDSLLGEFLSRKPVNRGSFSEISFTSSSSNGSLNTNEDGLLETPEPRRPASSVMEKILLRRSLQLRNQQQAWQESPEGQKMIDFRNSLPSYKERDVLLRAISDNQVIVVSGETGCGKTTQLPQYILESEIDATRGALCSIICTQPRRISAMSVSERVAAERGEQLGESVGYKVRLEGIKGRDTRLLFCTTGVLLRRLLVDRDLRGVTHVIVDEIHERGMNEDFLLIVLRDLLPRRPELRLILMSATLNAELFSSYFSGAPMMHIPGFTHPVRAHFLEDIVETTGYRLTPYNQVDDYGQEKMWKMQRQALRKRKSQIASSVEDALEAANFDKYSLRTRESLACWNPDSIGFNLIENVLCHICRNGRPGAVLVFMTGWDDINSLKEQLQAHPLLGDPSRVLVLACHGSMASSEQRLIFNKPEEGVRKIVLATNMAETSITINDVVFVVDCGKAKETSYDALNNTPCLLPSWISKASARQRRGRAGRVQPGECYHLYPRCVYDAFAEYQLPELLRTPLQSLCLQIKSLQLGSISEFLSRALQSPELLSVQNAIEYLKVIGALDEKENLTILGRHLSMLPVEPKLGKMLILGAIFNCLDPILTVVAGLSVRDPFLMPFDKKDLAESAKSQFAGKYYSDHLALVRAYEVICGGLYPGVSSVVNKGKSISTKTMEDGQVLLYANSVNAREQRIPYPWLVFNEKVKVHAVFLRDSTAISDSMLLLFGGNLSQGGLDGHLKMLGGYLEFFMKPALADTYTKLKRELEELIQKKLENPKMDIQPHRDLIAAVRVLVSEDPCEGRFVYGCQVLTLAMKSSALLSPAAAGGDGENVKNQLQTLLHRSGHGAPVYKTKQTKSNQFRSLVEFNGMQFIGKPCSSKKNAEKDAASEALQWLTGGAASAPEDIDRMSTLLKKTKKKMPRRW